MEKNFLACQEMNPGRLARSLALYRHEGSRFHASQGEGLDGADRLDHLEYRLTLKHMKTSGQTCLSGEREKGY
jgi:hypothetical protein